MSPRQRAARRPWSPRAGYLIWLLLCVMLAGCGSAAPPSPEGQVVLPGGTTGCPDAPGPLSGPLVINSLNNLFSMAADGSASLQLTRLPEQEWAIDPAWSPDGKTLAYALFRTSRNPKFPWQTWATICSFDRGTGKGQALAVPSGINDSFEEPRWSSDGKALFFTFHTTRLNSDETYGGDIFEVSRYDLERKERVALVQDDARTPVPSPDGTRLAFLRTNQQTFLAELVIAEGDGKNPVAVALPSRSFGSYQNVRWSPDGTRLLFTATGGPDPLPPPTPVPTASVKQRPPIFYTAMGSEHRGPADFWIVTLAGARVERVTKQQMSQPQGEWSPHGGQVLYMSELTALTLVDVSTGQERVLSPLTGMGGVAWAAQ